MTIVPRILLLIAFSLTGIALLAPLAARSSAAPVPAAEAVDGLLPAADRPATALDRSVLSVRVGGASQPAPSIEALEGEPLPTPGSAPMEATLHSVATPPRAPAPAPAAPPRPASSGDSVWDDLARCESGGNWSINTGNGYYGGLQFSYGTWHQYGGGEFADYPHQASRAEQIIVAERLRADRGYAPWPACRAKLGLP